MPEPTRKIEDIKKQMQEDRKAVEYYKHLNVYQKLGDPASVILQRQKDLAEKSIKGGHVMELNSGSPGGWGYAQLLMHEWRKTFLSKKFNNNPVVKKYYEVLEKASKGVKLPDVENGLSNLAQVFIEEAVNQGKSEIVICAVGSSSLMPLEEDGALAIEIFSLGAENRGIRVSILTLKDLIEEVKNKSRNVEDILMHADFTPSELDNEFPDVLEREYARKVVAAISSFGPHSIEAKTGRNWLKDLCLSTKDHPYFREVKESGPDLEVVEKDVFYKGAKIDPEKHILKVDGTSSGKGILFPKEWDAENVKQLITDGIKFTLEEFVIGPKNLNLLLMTRRRIDAEGYASRLTKYIGEFTVDTRIVCLFIPKEEGKLEIKPLSIIGRMNYPDRPDNIGAGGAMVPIVVVVDDEYENVVQAQAEFLANIGDDIVEIKSDLDKRLSAGGFNLLGTLMPYGFMPHILSESTYRKMSNATEIAAQRIQSEHPDVFAEGKQGASLLALDMYADPAPEN
jgi:hypothetical protein